MPSATLPKNVQVLADLTITSPKGNIQIENDSGGSLEVRFSDKQPFFALLNAQLSQQAGWRSLIQMNKELYRTKQALVVKVKGRTWITLGKSSLPRINYHRLALPYISNNPSLKNGLYVVGAAIGATLLYTIFRRRN
ncbi:MAG: hypothetical protein AAF223_20305 [Bacteroidota bacterium]